MYETIVCTKDLGVFFNEAAVIKLLMGLLFDVICLGDMEYILYEIYVLYDHRKYTFIYYYLCPKESFISGFN
jgi:hypothetical protein